MQLLTGITLGCNFSDSAKNASAQTWTEKWFGFLLRISTEMVRIHPRISPDEVRNSPSDFNRQGSGSPSDFTRQGSDSPSDFQQEWVGFLPRIQQEWVGFTLGFSRNGSDSPSDSAGMGRIHPRISASDLAKNGSDEVQTARNGSDGRQTRIKMVPKGVL